MTTIRAKIIGGFLLIALLVPVLGVMAISSVQRISDRTSTTEDDALPAVLAAKDLNTLQRMQQEAVLAYLAGGAAEDRQRYDDLQAAINGKLSELHAALTRASGGDARAADGLMARIVDERARFQFAADELLNTRDTTAQNLETVRVKAEEIIIELTVMRARFNANPFAQPAQTNQAGGQAQAATVRAQVWELLFGVQGIMSGVAFEAAISTGYAMTRNPVLMQRFQDASSAFPNYVKSAKSAAGPEDRPFIDRVETKFYQEFEPAARGLIELADSAAATRLSFNDASSAIGSQLDELATLQTARLGRAQQEAQGTVADSRRILVVTTLLAFALAGGLGFWFAQRITRPILDLRDAANRISAGDLSDTTINRAGTDEVGDLARAFHRMLASVRILMARDEPDQEVRSHVA
jgi:methyl-accepting chemotaxis protein